MKHVVSLTNGVGGGGAYSLHDIHPAESADEIDCTKNDLCYERILNTN